MNISCVNKRVHSDITPRAHKIYLRLLAGIFDPMGMIDPITITVNILFQNACRQEINWDDPLDGMIKQDAEAWIRGLIEFKEIMIDRCVYEHMEEEVLEWSLPGFVDARKKAYCTVIYFAYRTNTGSYLKMLACKIRVAPLKELSIPRLICIVKNTLVSQVSVLETKLWSDSMTVLY